MNTIQLEERILLLLSSPCLLVGLVFGVILILNVIFTKALHKPRHLFQAMSVFSSLVSEVFGLYGIMFLARSCGFISSSPQMLFYLFIWNRYLLLLSDILPSLDRFAAIFCPLKYHIHASCSTGKIVCFLTFLLTIGLTIMSYLLGVVPVHLGHGPLDHFLLVSTRMFVFSLTLPFFSCLILCFCVDSTALFVALKQLKIKQKKPIGRGISTDETDIDFTTNNAMAGHDNSEQKEPCSGNSSEDHLDRTPGSSPKPPRGNKKARVNELQLSSRCLMLAVFYFLSQLCTYTPGIVFFGCGNIAPISGIVPMNPLGISGIVSTNNSYPTHIMLNTSETPDDEHVVTSPLLSNAVITHNGPSSLLSNTVDNPSPILRNTLGNPSTPLPPTNQTYPVKRSVNYRSLQNEDPFNTSYCDNLVSFLPRVFIFLFYQLQFLKSILFIMMDSKLREGITTNMSNMMHYRVT